METGTQVLTMTEQNQDSTLRSDSTVRALTMTGQDRQDSNLRPEDLKTGPLRANHPTCFLVKDVGYSLDTFLLF